MAGDSVFSYLKSEFDEAKTLAGHSFTQFVELNLAGLNNRAFKAKPPSTQHVNVFINC